MAGTTNTNKAAAAVLLLTLIVFIAGILAALTHDDGDKKTTTLPVPTTAPGPITTTTLKATTTTTAPATTTVTTLQALPPGETSTTKPPIIPTTTTAVPAVPSPEQAANGLFSAYRAGDRSGAARFATQDVISVLFAQPFNPPDATFQGCRPDGELYDCSYTQVDSSYAMTVQRNPNDNSFIVVIITVTRPTAPSSTATAAP